MKKSAVPKGYPESTIRLSTLLRDVEHDLDLNGVTDPLASAEWLLTYVFKCTRSDLFTRSITASDERIGRLSRMVERRKEGEPVQYIVGVADFFGLSLAVGPAALVPRPETEVLVEHALRVVSNVERPRILDVGTGTGCIGLALKSVRPDGFVTACDCSEGALVLAAANARSLDLDIRLLHADVFGDAFVSSVGGPFDLVVSNPPYVRYEEIDSLPVEVAQFEPAEALFAEGDGLGFYRRFSELAPELLVSGGHLVIEINEDAGRSVVDELGTARFSDTNIHSDLAGKDRVVTATARVID